MSNYIYKVETDFYLGYRILRKVRASNNPWISVARIDNEKGITFSQFTNSDEKKEIQNIAYQSGLL